MKHFTKEYYTLERLSYANQHVKKTKNAEHKDESLYQRMYEKQYEIYLHLDRNSSWYQDPIEELRKIEEYINEPNITDEERSRRIEFKKAHEYINRKRIQSGIVFDFDEELCKQKFADRINALIAIYSRLPQEILDKIADIRVFALGYASADVKKLLRPYCAKLRRTVRQIKEKAYRETDEAEGYLTRRLGLNEFNDYLIMGIEEKNGDIYMKCENQELLIKEGKIIEGKEKTIYSYNEDIPNSTRSRIITAELHRTEGKFELHFLVSNSNGIEKEEFWYLTIRGTDILKNN